VIAGGLEPADRARRQREALRREGCDPGELRTVLSPYRICPVGAHVDHQGGAVLGMAIATGTVLCFAPSRGPGVRLRSDEFPGEARFDLRHPEAGEGPAWGRYPRGAALALRERLPAPPRGITGRVGGALPGAGLGSSASVLLATLRALAEANALTLSPAALVALSRRAENDFVGVASGILDPASIAGARRGHLLAIDTRREAWEPIAPGSPEPRVLVAFSGRTRNLAETGFNRRVEECREAAREIARRAGLAGVEVLGDLPEAALEAHLGSLPSPLARRARHFHGERRRVREGAELWRAGELAGFGRLMRESCESSIENFETGSPELVTLQRLLERAPGVLGSRFSGAGFGGCCVALALPEAAEAAAERVASEFARAFPELADRARAFVVESDDGVRCL
jgi:galactokinase/galacturonokinase